MEKYVTGKWINDVLELNFSHALYREDGIWYHHLERFPGVLFDANGYLIVNSREEYQNNSSFRRTRALTVKTGISNIKGYISFTEDQRRILLLGNILDNDSSSEQILRKLRQIEVLVRNQNLVGKIKSKYDNTCQLCGLKLKIRENIFYCEVHHIRPLGSPHNGPDNAENVICVCPTCHVKLDLGAIKIELKNVLILKHTISVDHLLYHNSKIFNYEIRK